MVPPGASVDAAGRSHPLGASRLHDALLSGRVLVGGIGVELVGQRRDSRVRMESEATTGGHAPAQVVEEHERLEALAQVARAHHAPDESMLGAASALFDASHGGLPAEV